MSRDARISSWPPVRVRRTSIKLTARFLTPLQYSFVQEAILKRLQWIWSMAIFVFVLDIIFLVLGTNILATYPALDRTQDYGILFACWAVYEIEHLFYFPICRFFLGKRITIVIKKGNIKISGTFLRKKVSLQHQPSFAIRPFSNASNPIYQNAQQLSLLVAQSRSIKIAEIFGQRQVMQIINNANTAITIAQERGL